MGTESQSAGPDSITTDLIALWGRDGWGFDPHGIKGATIAYVGEHDTSFAVCHRLTREGANMTVRAFPGAHLGFLAESVRDSICTTLGRLGGEGCRSSRAESVACIAHARRTHPG